MLDEEAGARQGVSRLKAAKGSGRTVSSDRSSEKGGRRSARLTRDSSSEGLDVSYDRTDLLGTGGGRSWLYGPA